MRRQHPILKRPHRGVRLARWLQATRNAKNVSSPSKGLALGIDQARVARSQFGRHGCSLASWLMRPSTQPPRVRRWCVGVLGTLAYRFWGWFCPFSMSSESFRCRPVCPYRLTLARGRVSACLSGSCECGCRVGRRGSDRWTQERIGHSPRRRSRRAGVRGLRARPHPGPKPRLNRSHQRSLVSLLKKGALAAGYPNDLLVHQPSPWLRQGVMRLARS